MLNKRNLFISLLILDTVLIFLAVYLGILENNRLKFFEEGGFITWFSTFKLLALAVLSFIIFYYRRQGRKEHSGRFSFAIWFLIALGGVFLAADELFQFHEKADVMIHKMLSMKETRLSDRIDDLIIGVYLVLGVIFLYGCRKELLQYLKIYPFIILGFTISIIMVFLDMYTNLAPGDWISPTIYRLSITEDALKIYAESFFLMAFINAVGEAGNPGRKYQGPEKT